MKWCDSDVEIVNIDETLYALNGWNGERWTQCWKCIDRFTPADCSIVFEVAPVYDMDAWNEADGEFQDADGNAVSGIIGYEVRG